MVKRIFVFTGMVVGTGFTGFIFGFAGAFIGASLLRGDLFGFGALAGALGGMIIGYPVGVLIAIIVINKLLRRRGSLWLGALGAVLGAVLTMGLATK